MTADALLPNWSAEGLALVARLMPGPGANAPRAEQGQNMSGPAASLMNRLVPPATRPQES